MHSHKHHTPPPGHGRLANHHPHHDTDGHTGTHAHSDPRPEGAASPRIHQMQLQAPPGNGLYVRYFYTFKGEPACEVWNNKRRVAPPPYLVTRADPSKDDCIFRVGDTILGSKWTQDALKYYGFADAESNAFSALLFFLLDMGFDDDRYQTLLTFRHIYPDLSNQYKGSVVFSHSLVVGSTILPFPAQRFFLEDFQVSLIYGRLADDLEELLVIIQGFYGVMMDVLWLLTGEGEVKVAAEVTEKYVAREVMMAALKFLKPKFVAIVKEYIIGFGKELAKEVFGAVLHMVQTEASDKLMATTGAPGGGVITIQQIHWLQSSNKLNKAADQLTIKWDKCHSEGMQEALKPFWKLLGGSRMANGAFRRFLVKCGGYVETFFFDLGLATALKKGEDFTAKKLGKAINEKISEATTDWMKEALGSGKPVEAKTAEKRVEAFTMSKLTDGTIIELGKKYFDDNWEKLAKKAIDKAEEELVKAVKGGGGEAKE
jgi:hypothetical protein